MHSTASQTLRRSCLFFVALGLLAFLPACGEEKGGAGGDGADKSSKAAKSKTEDGGKKASGGSAEDFASQLVFVDPEGFPCHSITPEVMESHPVQLGFLMVRDMPTPGYTIEIDEAKLQADGKTVIAKMTSIPPKGAGMTVLESRDIHVNIGSIAKGSYVFELHERTSKDGKYARIGSFPFEAK